MTGPKSIHSILIERPCRMQISKCTHEEVSMREADAEVENSTGDQ